MRTLRVGGADGLGLGEGVVSCASKNEVARNPIVDARTVFVMSSEVVSRAVVLCGGWETSLTFSSSE